MTSFLKQTLPQTSNHLIQMQMKRNTLTALLALALSAWAVPSAQAQTEEQHLNHAVSYDLPRLVAQKGVENVYDAIGALPGITVQNGVYTLGGRAIVVSINGETQNVAYNQLQELLRAMPASGIERVEIVYNPAARMQANAPLIALSFKRGDGESRPFAAEVGGDIAFRHRTLFGERASGCFRKGPFSLDLSYLHSHGRVLDALRTDIPQVLSPSYEDITNTQERLTATCKHSYRLAATYTFGARHTLSATYQGFNTNNDLSVSNTYSHLGYADGKAKAWLHNARIDYATPLGIRLGIEAAFFRAPERHVLMGYVNPFTLDPDFSPWLARLLKENLLVTDSLRTDLWRAYIAGEHELNNGWTINYGAWFKKVKHNSVVHRRHQARGEYSVSWHYPEEHFTTAYVGVSKRFGEKLSAEVSLSADYYHHVMTTQWRALPTFSISYAPCEGNVLSLSVSGSRDYPHYSDLNGLSQPDNGGRLYTVSDSWPMPSLHYQAQLSYVTKGGFQFRTWYNRASGRVMQQPYANGFLDYVLLKNCNIDRHQQVGLQAVMPHQFGSWLYTCLTLGGAWTRDKHEARMWEEAVNSRIIHGEAQFTGVATLCTKPDIALSVDAFGQTKTQQGLWELPARMQVDMSLRWTFLKDMATLRLFCNDVLADGTPKYRYMYFTNEFDMRNVPRRQVGMGLTIRL